MTDNEIITCDSFGCTKCPKMYSTKDIGECKALVLINRQKAEIERLEGWENLLKAEKHSLIKAEAIKEFAERLKEKDGNEFIKSDYEGKDEIYWFDQPEYESFVDNLVKEMVGADK